jgi:hypothetical protein
MAKPSALAGSDFRCRGLCFTVAVEDTGNQRGWINVVAGRGGLRVWLMAPVLLPVCFWLAWPWLPVQTVTRGIIVEFECLRSEQRTACLQQRHHEAEVRALKAIQDELQELTRERPSAQAAETDGRHIVMAGTHSPRRSRMFFRGRDTGSDAMVRWHCHQVQVGALVLMMMGMATAATAQPGHGGEANWPPTSDTPEACIEGEEKSSSTGRACLGKHARRCLAIAEREPLVHVETCYAPEVAAWALLVNRYVGQRPKDASDRRFMEVQRASRVHRKLRCDYVDFHHGGGDAGGDVSGRGVARL